MRCERCGLHIEGSAKFCSECGALLGKQCDACGTALPESARFCLECGTSRSHGGTVKTPTEYLASDDTGIGIILRVDQTRYTGPAFFMPGAELWFGEHWVGSRLNGVTKNINIITLERDNKEIPVVNEQTASLWKVHHAQSELTCLDTQ